MATPPKSPRVVVFKPALAERVRVVGRLGILLAVIVAMIFLRGQIENIFSNIGNNLT